MMAGNKPKERPYWYIEIWYAKDSWWELPLEERKKLFGGIDPSVHSEYATLLSAAVNESTDKLGDQEYLAFAVWEIDDESAGRKIRDLVSTSPQVAWFRQHFEQHTVWGLKDRSPDGPVFRANTERGSGQTLTGRIDAQGEKIERLADSIDRLVGVLRPPTQQQGGGEESTHPQ